MCHLPLFCGATSYVEDTLAAKHLHVAALFLALQNLVDGTILKVEVIDFTVKGYEGILLIWVSVELYHPLVTLE